MCYYYLLLIYTAQDENNSNADLKAEQWVMMLNDAVQMGCPQVQVKLLDEKVLQSLRVSYISTPLYGFICSKAASLEG